MPFVYSQIHGQNANPVYMAVKCDVVLSPLRQTFFICVSQYNYEGMALCGLMVIVSNSL